MPWGDYLNTGTVETTRKVRGRMVHQREQLNGWRDTENRAVSAPLARAGTDFVRSHVPDLVIVGSRTTTPPACHVETPSAR